MDVNKESIRGGAHTAVSQFVIVTIQLLSTIVLARLLSPDDYGIMGMAVSFTLLANIFKDLGLSSAAIQKPHLSTTQRSNLFWLNLAFGLILAAILTASASLVAEFYGREELTYVVTVLSISFVLAGAGAQHHAMLVRNMRFGRLAIANIAGALGSFVTALLMAANGLGYWSLVWGSVVGALVRSIALWSLGPFKLLLWRKSAGTRELISFGADVTGFNLVNYASRNLDKILIGRFVGAEQLGFYGRADQLVLFPVNNIRGPVSSVAFPALSRLDPYSHEFEHYYLLATKVIAWCTIPIMTLLYWSSDVLVLLLLGEGWEEVGPIVAILAIAGVLLPATSVRGILPLAIGESRRYLWAGTLNGLIMTLSFVVGIRWGAQGVAWAYAIATWLAFIPLQVFCNKGTGIRIMNVITGIVKPVSSLAVTLPSLIFLEYIINLNNIFILLFMQFFIILVILFVFLYFFERKMFDYFLKYIIRFVSN